jgi:hypothetical protein
MTANLNEFGIFFLLGLDFQSPTWTSRLTSEFSEITRASRVLLIPINRPLNIKENTQALGMIKGCFKKGVLSSFL